jgi:hypothetical protein
MMIIRITRPIIPQSIILFLPPVAAGAAGGCPAGAPGLAAGPGAAVAGSGAGTGAGAGPAAGGVSVGGVWVGVSVGFITYLYLISIFYHVILTFIRWPVLI